MRSDPSLVIMGRTGAVSITGLDDAIARAKAYEATGVDALFFTGIKSGWRTGSDLGSDHDWQSCSVARRRR